ncbi:MAG: flagellar biosynthesis anti-sigma factor FlgM [Candidatus Competibacteraceae bacterium]|nr:MAG: flagellar biosynthesis anti-sigma factor FlgM [Candidatus Competibacteraceae bacterium]
MAININGIQFSSVRGDSAVDRPASTKSGPMPSSGSPGKPVSEIDPVRLTPSSQALRQMEADREPPIDEARIAALRQAIEEGSYPINARQIAEKMSTFESTLFG